MVLPFMSGFGDRGWPENFGGVDIAPAVDLVSAVYMSVPEEDQ